MKASNSDRPAGSVRSREDTYRERQQALRRALSAEGLSRLLVTTPANVRYLSGYSGSNGWLLLRARSAVLLTDVRYREQAKKECRGVQVRITERRTFTEELMLSDLLRSTTHLGFERDHIGFAVHANLKKALDGVRLVPTSGLVESLRRRKDAAELRSIRRALHITEQVLLDILPLLAPGRTEIDIAAEITYRQRKLGADGDSFPAIVLGGARTSLVHGTPSAYRFRRGDLVLMDFGCTVDGYCSDMTRTVSIGRPSAYHRRLYEAVRRAQEEGVAAVRHGARAADVDGAVRALLDADGYGRYFEHALGHGVGLDIHEAPVISPRAAAPLSDGEVVTIEPGVYVPGRGGVRIEDMVLVSRGGPRRLTSLTTELLEV